MTAVGFITFISVLSRLLGLLKKCIIIIYILCIDCAENNKILFDLNLVWLNNTKCKNKDSSDAAESLDPELDPEESDREEKYGQQSDFESEEDLQPEDDDINN